MGNDVRPREEIMSAILPPTIRIVIEIDTQKFTGPNPGETEIKISCNAPMSGFQMLGVFHSAMAWALQQVAAAASSLVRPS
jgi:hypothetical protein